MLATLLARSQDLGFLGAAPLLTHVAHAEAFLVATRANFPVGPLLDLGSGGGIPGLVVACRLPEVEIVLLEGGERRSQFLAGAVAELGLTDRVSVVAERAELAGRRSELRHRFRTVLARGFGPPAVTAECAAPLLGEQGQLIVSEPPPGSPTLDRWPVSGCDLLGLEVEEHVTEPFAFVRLRARRRCAERYPRRVGVPSKRPLF